MNTGKYIKSIRKELQMTQKQMGKIIGKPDSRISEWEKNIHSPSLSEFLEMCQALKVKNFNKLFKDLL